MLVEVKGKEEVTWKLNCFHLTQRYGESLEGGHEGGKEERGKGEEGEGRDG